MARPHASRAKGAAGKKPASKASVSKTSKGWLKEHFDDRFVQQSWQDGYRSRASYKLLALDEKDNACCGPA